MRHFKTAVICGMASTVVGSVAAAPRPELPDGVSATKPMPKLDPPSLACAVDPAITQVTLTKGKSPGSVTVTIEARNLGRNAWRSGTRQQMLSLSVRNGNTGAASSHSWPLSASAPAGSSMGRFTTPLIPNAFDTFEFRGTVNASIVYDPDIRIDGNNCNDDTNASNNVKNISDDQVGRLLASKSGSMAF